MAFRMSPMSVLRATAPDKFEKKLKTAIVKHRGVALHIAQDLDVGISTFKRWIEEDPGFTRFLASTRKLVAKSKAAA